MPCPLLGAAHLLRGGAVASQGDTVVVLLYGPLSYPGIARAELSSREGSERQLHPSVAHGEARGSVHPSLVL